ncbi:glycosyltransferase family 2 protein [Opitutus terrae]|uniref:Glycosyl transferase family 2 n=1 Tax=Opitutus terrae (strain DSM 11246 / JCM 15787 / PB90-1) TaxID=452637 RepID=B1ZZT5_OPITP|nr:glycosyltransferase family 2 protein [Opitutus terrae]ACB77271.1 glycosyl transferase family 2 [Opitutus terrae PB90-1]
MNRDMQVSFVVPLYNCLDLTQAMIASLQATVPRDLAHEIILVDDGSTDGTRAWLATLGPPFRVVLNARNVGYAAANNRGAAVATGRFLVLLNNDLVLTPGWLPPMLAVHRRLGAHAGFVGNVQLEPRSRAIDHAGMVVNLQAKPEHLRSLPPRALRWARRMRLCPAVTGACALIERVVWEQLGGFDDGFHNGGEDVDLCLRLRARGRRNAVALRSIVLHHISASPGRKQRDEQNSRRLAQRWRAELESLAYRRWCWNYLDRQWTSPHPALDHADARAALAFVLGLRRTPPAIAVDGMRAAMDREIARWDKIFGAGGPPSAASAEPPR